MQRLSHNYHVTTVTTVTWGDMIVTIRLKDSTAFRRISFHYDRIASQYVTLRIGAGDGGAL
ncbi:hypothetical protein AA0228_1069 [Gluconobacter frateurii NRIC 0228]|uniref:Uncharacterized protein n=1 Tax=Gluconobacter frateurii NRIC 0228 TaxID=1307946 RepID=A0ABQ0QA46_9PROT|nr:hypothetical protein AA0228_1069 [Gluconobacter frateurii NRIC 0228]